MFSWSSKWLWAQCLAASAGLFLLGHMALPPVAELTAVSGTVAQVDVISRKGLGSYNELTVIDRAGDRQRVLIARDAETNSVIAALIGKSVAAQVNWSDVAVEFDAPAAPATLGQSVRAAATAQSSLYNYGGTFAFALGMFLILAHFILNKPQQSAE